MRFLVLGSSGMAGNMLCAYLSESGYDVTGLSRRGSKLVKDIKGDATDFGFLRGVLEAGEYDIAVNCIGVLNRDAEERKDLAALLNGCLPHVLAEITQSSPTRIIHLSTDCVFAGNTGPYLEDSFPDGATFYDRSKAMGELDDEKNLTLRQSIVGPDPNPEGIGLLNWFMAQEETAVGFTNAIWTGLTTLELAKAIEACAIDGSTGLVNMVPDAAISKFDLLKLFNKHLRHNSLAIDPVGEPRIDKTLARTNTAASFRPKEYVLQVEEMASWMCSHRSLYPHYRLDELK